MWLGLLARAGVLAPRAIQGLKVLGAIGSVFGGAVSVENLLNAKKPKAKKRPKAKKKAKRKVKRGR